MFSELGFGESVHRLIEEIQALYLADAIPWVVGYSGGKDSTAVLQLVWMALSRLAPDRRHKTVHVISTDTLVENPIVARWADRSLDAMRAAAARDGLPIFAHRLTPAVEDSFWVLLIGKGYPAPRRLFRWCTDRLKIRPSTRFIRDVVSAHGEAILVLGTRKAESAGRAARMERLEESRVRDRLSPNVSQPGSLVYSPIEDWSNDDVWLFLMQEKNPWGWDNKALLTLYQGASDGGECPLVVDTSTPSCGASRFGCWVCTLVEQDKSMSAMIQNDVDKEWMLPLLELRNALDFRQGEDGDRHLRDFRRMNGKVQLMMTGQGPRVIPGPYTQSARADWLRRLLAAERWIRANGPEDVRTIELITMPELHAIRRIWVEEKHEIEDLLPGIYEAERGAPFPGEPLGVPGFVADDLALLQAACGGDPHMYTLARDLLATEHRYRQMQRRAGLFPALEKVLRRHAYRSEEEAIAAQTERQPGQLALFEGTPIEVESPEARKQRAVGSLSAVGRVPGVLGELARHAVNDLAADLLESGGALQEDEGEAA
jgi:DNA sulfur modification protein DndC